MIAQDTVLKLLTQEWGLLKVIIIDWGRRSFRGGAGELCKFEYDGILGHFGICCLVHKEARVPEDGWLSMIMDSHLMAYEA